MTNVEDLRERLVGQRFFDKDQGEAFTVVGITDSPSLALLQYDDGAALSEGAVNFTVEDDVAQRAGLDKDGLDSERYRQLGPGPRIEQTCKPNSHEWYPQPDELWPNGPSEKVREQIPDHPRTFYNRIVRCKRCGLSGTVAGQFGRSGSRSDEFHGPPWFCIDCNETHPNADLIYWEDLAYCPDCAVQIDTDGVDR